MFRKKKLLIFEVTLVEKRNKKKRFTQTPIRKEQSDDAGLQLECIAVAKLKPFIVPAE